MASTRAAVTVHGPGRRRAATTRATIAAAITPTVTRCSAERFTSGRDRNVGRELAHLVQALRDQLKPALQPAVERGPRQVQPFHDHLVAADALDVVVQQQASGLLV